MGRGGRSSMASAQLPRQLTLVGGEGRNVAPTCVPLPCLTGATVTWHSPLIGDTFEALGTPVILNALSVRIVHYREIKD